MIWNFYANCIEVMLILVLGGKCVFEVRGMRIKEQMDKASSYGDRIKAGLLQPGLLLCNASIGIDLLDHSPDTLPYGQVREDIHHPALIGER